jgi:hypothetical protein
VDTNGDGLRRLQEALYGRPDGSGGLLAASGTLEGRKGLFCSWKVVFWPVTGRHGAVGCFLGEGGWVEEGMLLRAQQAPRLPLSGWFSLAINPAYRIISGVKGFCSPGE